MHPCNIIAETNARFVNAAAPFSSAINMPYDISVVKMTPMRMHHRAMYMAASRLLNVRSGVSTTGQFVYTPDVTK